MLQKTAPTRNLKATLPKKRVLVVNCYFDDSRQPIRRTSKIPQAVGPIYSPEPLPANFAKLVVTPKSQGPLEDEPCSPVFDRWSDRFDDSFDRHAAPGSLCPQQIPSECCRRRSPSSAAALAEVFDYSAGGMKNGQCDRRDFWRCYVAEKMMPRTNLAYWLGRIG